MSQVRKLIEAAKRYEKYGIVCVPTGPGTKHPAMLGWSTLTATPYDEFHPDNTGYRETVAMHILTGKASNLICIDIDDKATWDKILKFYESRVSSADVDFSRVIRETTPSGGLHYYFSYDRWNGEPVKTTSKCVISKSQLTGIETNIDIDVRGDGNGLSICAPSLYCAEGKPEKVKYNGQPYKWILSPKDAKWDKIVISDFGKKFMKLSDEEVDRLESKSTYNEHCPSWLRDLVTGAVKLVTDADGNFIDEIMPETTYKKLVSKDESCDNDDESDGNYRLATLDEIRYGLSCINVCDYDEWRWKKMIFSVARGADAAGLDSDDVIDLLDDWSSGDPAHYSGKVSVAAMYARALDGIGISESKVSFATFRAAYYGIRMTKMTKERAELKEAIAASRAEAAEQINPFSDADYVWEDFVAECTGQIFSSDDVAKTFIAERINRVLAFVSMGNGSYLKKDTFDVISRLKDFDAKSSFTVKYYHTVVDNSNRKTKNPDKIVVSETGFISIMKKLVSRFTSADYHPANCPPRTFNLWRGFKAKHVPPSAERDKLIEPILNLLKTAFCSTLDKDTGITTFRENDYLWLLSYFRELLVKPELKTGVCLFLQSVEGSGKNTFVDFFSRYVIGEHLYYQCLGLEKAGAKFNKFLEGKLLVVVNELAAGGFECRDYLEVLKSMITDDRMSIEPKGVDPYMVTSYLNYIMMSNHDDALYISYKDRRYACYGVDDIYAGPHNRPFWVKFRKDVFNQNAGDAFYSYLVDLDPTKLPDPRVVPNTPLRAKMIRMKRNTVHSYVEELVDKHNVLRLGGNPTYMSSVNTYRAKWAVDDLYADYVEWCRINGNKIIKTKDTFCKDINDGPDNKPLLEKKKSNTYWYIIPEIADFKIYDEDKDETIVKPNLAKLDNELTTMDDADAAAILEFIANRKKEKLAAKKPITPTTVIVSIPVVPASDPSLAPVANVSETKIKTTASTLVKKTPIVKLAAKPIVTLAKKAPIAKLVEKKPAIKNLGTIKPAVDVMCAGDLGIDVDDIDNLPDDSSEYEDDERADNVDG